MESFKLQFKAAKENIPHFDDDLEKILNKWDVTCKKELHFAIHEVFINAVQACEKSSKQCTDEIVICLNKDSKKIACKVTDYFGGMDVSNVSRDFAKCIDSGRGLLFVDHLVDSLKYEFDDDDCFSVILEKYL